MNHKERSGSERLNLAGGIACQLGSWWIWTIFEPTIPDRLAKILFGSGFWGDFGGLLRAGGLGRQVYSRTGVRPSPGSVSGVFHPVPVVWSQSSGVSVGDSSSSAGIQARIACQGDSMGSKVSISW